MSGKKISTGDAALSAAEIEALFTRSDGSFSFARWGRPIVPVVFGVTDETLGVIKGAIEAMVGLAGHSMAETDPELGANLLIFFIRDWEELSQTPKLGELIPELGGLVGRLETAEASQYRAFRFDAEGAIQACFSFVRVDAAMAEAPAEMVAIGQALGMILAWSDVAFREVSPFAVGEEGVRYLRPGIGALVRAGYEEALPVASEEASLALRLAARAG